MYTHKLLCIASAILFPFIALSQSPIAFSEIAPRAKPEWIEVVNTSDIPISLEGWSVATNSDTVSLPVSVIGAGGCAVLGTVKPSSNIHFIQLEKKLTLNNYCDTLFLLYQDETFDTCFWDNDTLPRWGAESLIISSKGLSLSVPTPGVHTTTDITSNWSLKVEKEVYFPEVDSSLVIRIQGPYGVEAKLLLYSIEGELLCRKRVYGSETVEWGGVDRSGRVVQSGPILIELLAEGNVHLRSRSILWRE